MNPLFSTDRNDMRRYFCAAWQGYCTGRPLEPLESQLAAIIREHPEYHALLADEAAACNWEPKASATETNPFLHMSMHLALHEQIGTDRPPGIRGIYRDLLAASGEAHSLEHRMMDCLGRALWEAQRSGVAPDESAYLACLRGLAGTVRSI